MKLVFQSGPRSGQAIDLTIGQAFTIGREAADLVIDDPRVSRPHARILVGPQGEATIEDLNSTNGTVVNGRRIVGTSPLRNGDTLGIGNTKFSVGDPAVRSGQPTVVGGAEAAGGIRAQPNRSGLTTIRQGVASANRRAGIAVAVAAIVILVAVVAGGYYFLVGKPLSNEEVIARMKSSVVFILAQGPNSGTGSGWVIDSDKGLIVTNNHVIQQGRSFRVSADGITPRSATVLAASPCDDVAVLHVDDKAGLAAVKVGSQANLKQGDDVLALGFPGTASSETTLVVTPGAVSVVKTTYENDRDNDLASFPNVILSTAKINPGNSGGPLVDRSASVVGMNTRTNSRLDQNYSIGIDRIKEITGQLSAGRGIGWTGMGFVTPTAADLTAVGFPADATGLLIVSAVPGSEADIQRFGQYPSLLTAIDGRPIADNVDYCTAARTKQSGDTGDFTLLAIPPGATRAVEGTYTIHFR
ncbi:MAG: trypsin-like peptidase domain-containing protein [Chloroflexi bacterium]|nr:trypsin-like peptidase domain-containing protein [Chloroflexota bacterium]